MKKPPRHIASGHQTEIQIGPNGLPLCRWCKKDVHPPKRTFCGDPVCVHEWKIRSDGGYARDQVFLRDKGKCKSCGLDTEKLRALIFRIKTEKGEEAYQEFIFQMERQTGYTFSLDKHAWEMDHIQPVDWGGGSCGLENLQTLCCPCHRVKTRRQRRIKRRGRVMHR